MTQSLCISMLLFASLLSACNPEESSVHSDAQSPAVNTITLVPDFSVIKDTKEKAFFDFLRPVIRAENAKVAKSPARMFAVAASIDNGDAVAEQDQQWLKRLARKYHIDIKSMHDKQVWKLLKRRVDTVTFRLAFAQAANESSWDTSRFARKGRNLFAEWCFKPGCGIMPSRRSAGMTHEVAVFKSVNKSVASYIYHLNRVDIYLPLRMARHDERKWGNKPTAYDLVGGLTGYSERGEAYVDDIRNIIRVNYDLMSGPQAGKTTTG